MLPGTDYIIFLNEEIAVWEKADKSRIYPDLQKQYITCKRVFDIIIALIFIITVLSWLTPLLTLIIKLNSKGPVFFLQERVGKDGHVFTCYKFRTMIPNRESDTLYALHNDRRITGIGKFLRWSNLDEFPQFFNVLAGDMSIVGPRPHMHADCSRFSELIPGYTFRNLVKPGITGLAQVKGFAGLAFDKEHIFGRYQWDAFYVRNAAFSLDLRIIRKTITQHFYLWVKPVVRPFLEKVNS